MSDNPLSPAPSVGHDVPTKTRGPATHVLHLKAPGSDDSYRIDIYVPDTPAPARGWGALLLLDGQGCFATAVEALRRMARRTDATGVEPVLLIGVSAWDGKASKNMRERDFGSRDEESAFADFLEQQVLAAIGDIALLDRERLALFGHSLGGYFALWMLAHRPRLFASVAAISPSVWWDEVALLDGLARAALDRQRLLICVGEWEGNLPPWQAARADSLAVGEKRRGRAMIDNARRVGALLAGRIGEDRVQFRLLEEEDHASIISAAIPRALRLASVPDSLIRSIEST